MSTSMTKEQWDAKEAEHCQFWKEARGETVLPRPYPGSVLEWLDGWTVGDWKHAIGVLRAERDVLRAERDVLLNDAGVLRAERDDALVHLKRATVEKQGLQDKVKHLESVLGRLRAERDVLLNDAGVLRAERDDALARYTKAIGGKDVALGNATRLRAELVKRDERIRRRLSSSLTRYNHESNVAYSEYSRLCDEIRRLARSLEQPVLNAAFDKQTAEYRVLYEAALALVKAVEEGDANVFIRDDDRSRALQALNRVLDGNTP